MTTEGATFETTDTQETTDSKAPLACPECGQEGGHDESSHAKNAFLIGCFVGVVSIFLPFLLALTILCWIGALVLWIRNDERVMTCPVCDHTWEVPG
jgi:hypothetical protein